MKWFHWKDKFVSLKKVFDHYLKSPVDLPMKIWTIQGKTWHEQILNYNIFLCGSWEHLSKWKTVSVYNTNIILICSFNFVKSFNMPKRKRWWFTPQTRYSASSHWYLMKISMYRFFMITAQILQWLRYEGSKKRCSPMITHENLAKVFYIFSRF